MEHYGFHMIDDPDLIDILQEEYNRSKKNKNLH